MLIRAYMMEHVCTHCLARPMISLSSLAEAQVTTVAMFFRWLLHAEPMAFGLNVSMK